MIYFECRATYSVQILIFFSLLLLTDALKNGEFRSGRDKITLWL